MKMMKKHLVLSFFIATTFAVPIELEGSATPQHPYGKPLNVLKMKSGWEKMGKDDGGWESDSAVIDDLFMHPEVKDRKAVVVSILGDFRKGKSFFLDYCLRFLYANYKSTNFMDNPLNNTQDWMGSPEEPLIGFSWKSGAKRDTTGIIFWSDVFLHTSESTGEKMAIFLVDSQGLFDSQTTAADNSRIFALTTLMSSLQIINIKDNVQENQLEYLQLATDFARLTAQNSNDDTTNKVFQTLLFLIRDWRHVETHDYGLKEGTSYIDNILRVKNKNLELHSVREHIYDFYEDIKGFLLPSPGRIVETGRIGKATKYDGHWLAMDEEFKHHLVELIEWLLHPSNLKAKRINGQNLSSADFKLYLESYFEKFTSETSPSAASIYELTVEKNMNLLVEKLIDEYQENFIANLDPTVANFSDEIKTSHEGLKNFSLKAFDAANKMGSSKHAANYKENLRQKLDYKFNDFLENALEIHEKFTEENEKIEQEMKSKDDQETKMLTELQTTLVKIAKLRFVKSEMKLEVYQSEMESLKALQENQKFNVAEYRRVKANRGMLGFLGILGLAAFLG